MQSATTGRCCRSSSSHAPSSCSQRLAPLPLQQRVRARGGERHRRLAAVPRVARNFDHVAFAPGCREYRVHVRGLRERTSGAATRPWPTAQPASWASVTPWRLHQRSAKTAFLFNSRMNSSQLFDFVLAEFDIPCESRSKSQQLTRLVEQSCFDCLRTCVNP